MKNAQWHDIKGKDFRALLNIINEDNGFELFDSEETSLRKAPMPFYNDLVLIDAVDFSSIPPMNIRFIASNNDFSKIVKIDGSKEAILKANKIEKPTLDEKNITDYASFALSCIMSEEGNFRLVQSIEEIDFSREPTDKEKKQLSAAIYPTKTNKKDEKFILDGCILYSDCVYRAIISVDDNGKVLIEEEKVILEEMPTRQIMLE